MVPPTFRSDLSTSIKTIKIIPYKGEAELGSCSRRLSSQGFLCTKVLFILVHTHPLHQFQVPLTSIFIYSVFTCMSSGTCHSDIMSQCTHASRDNSWELISLDALWFAGSQHICLLSHLTAQAHYLKSHIPVCAWSGL